MKITENLILRLISLLEGRSVPSSMLKGEWVEEMEREGILTGVYAGSRKSYKLTGKEAFLDYLEMQNGLLRNPYKALEIYRSDVERSELAADSGDSKLIKVRACPGFAVNSYLPVKAILRGKEIIIHPIEGTFLFISDWKHFSIGEDVIVVGIENMENFRKVSLQQDFFEICLNHYRLNHSECRILGNGNKLPPILFVARYPQSHDLVEWLKTISNPYFHFGDYDLEGIQIFLNEFKKHLMPDREELSDRSGKERVLEYLIPPDIEIRLANGSRRRYNKQYDKTRNIVSDDPALIRLIALINGYRRGYDQEGYIAKPIIHKD